MHHDERPVPGAGRVEGFENGGSRRIDRGDSDEEQHSERGDPLPWASPQEEKRRSAEDEAGAVQIPGGFEVSV
jgi:hypothetical protein